MTDLLLISISFFDTAVADALVLGLLHTEAVMLTDEVLPKQQDIWFFLPSTTSQTKSPIPMGLLHREFTFLIISALQLIWKRMKTRHIIALRRKSLKWAAYQRWVWLYKELTCQNINSIIRMVILLREDIFLWKKI